MVQAQPGLHRWPHNLTTVRADGQGAKPPASLTAYLIPPPVELM